MKQTNKFLSFLGLTARAGKIITGEEMVVKGIQQGKIYLVIVAKDASDNTRKKISDKCNFYQIPYKEAFERDLLGDAIGKASRVVIGISDKGFSQQLEKLLE